MKHDIHIAVYIKKELVYRSTDVFTAYNRLFKQNVIATDINGKLVRLSSYYSDLGKLPDLEHRFHLAAAKIQSKGSKPTLATITIIPGVFITISNAPLRNDWYPHHLLSVYPVAFMSLTSANEYIEKVLNYTNEIQNAIDHINSTMDKRIIDDVASVFVMINIFAKTYNDYKTFRLFKDDQVINKYYAKCKKEYHVLIRNAIELLTAYIKTHIKDYEDQPTLNLISNLINHNVLSLQELVAAQIITDNPYLRLKVSAIRYTPR